MKNTLRRNLMTMNNEYHFYDTSALLEREKDLFSINENVVISSITLEELDNLKPKNPKARRIIKLLEQNKDKYEVLFYNDAMFEYLHEVGLTNITPDTQILATALHYDIYIHPDETIFITNDLHLKVLANYFFGEDSIKSIEQKKDNYKGYKTVALNREQFAKIYEEPTNNQLQALTNQYIIIKDVTNTEIVDKVRWDGQSYQSLRYGNFKSDMFGEVKPQKGDIYQQFAFDSLLNNQITMLKGPAGSGKSLIAMSYLFFLLEKHKIDKIIIFCNTVATKNSARLGFYPGTRDEKLLDSQIGNFLISKLGDRIIVEELIKQGKLVLLPMSDVRGYDTSGMKAGIYITEAQNMDVSLMKLALQRIGEDSLVIIDGDCDAQVDDIAFEGPNNGMRRLSEVFRDTDFYGEVQLQRIHRSKIAERAQRM